MQVSVYSDLYKAGVTEDGQDYSAECYYVAIEDSQGHRWAHFMTFNGCHTYYNHEDGVYVFEDIREESRKKAEALCERIKESLACGVSLNMSLWTALPHAYGSEAYQREGGNEEMAAWERSCEGNV